MNPERGKIGGAQSKVNGFKLKPSSAGERHEVENIDKKRLKAEERRLRRNERSGNKRAEERSTRYQSSSTN